MGGLTAVMLDKNQARANYIYGVFKTSPHAVGILRTVSHIGEFGRTLMPDLFVADIGGLKPPEAATLYEKIRSWVKEDLNIQVILLTNNPTLVPLDIRGSRWVQIMSPPVTEEAWSFFALDTMIASLDRIAKNAS